MKLSENLTYLHSRTDLPLACSVTVHIVHAFGIPPRTCMEPVEMISISSISANDDDNEEAIARCAILYDSECTRMHLRTPKATKISWGSMPPDLSRVNSCRVAMFSTSANKSAPPPPPSTTTTLPQVQVNKLSTALELSGIEMSCT